MNIPKLTSYLRQLSISGDLNQAELVRTVIETAPPKYQSYVAKLSVNAEGNPVVSVLYNDIPGTITLNSGDYIPTTRTITFTKSDGGFDPNKTLILFDPGNLTPYVSIAALNTSTPVGYVRAYINTGTSKIEVIIGTPVGVLDLQNASIEIRVYP